MILDLEAVWCHWCHVMEKTTYQDEKVVALLKSKYLTVRVDQDANPDLSNRYGDWGWPATIIFASDGTELAKWRGYLPPERMASLLEAFIADPTPGPSARFSPADVTPAESPLLSKSQREDLLAAARTLMTPSTAAGTPSTNSSTPRAWTFCSPLLRRAARRPRNRRDKRSMWRQNLIDRAVGRHLSIFRRSRLEVAALREDHVVSGERLAPIRCTPMLYGKTRSISPPLQNLKRFLMIKLRGA